MATKKPSYITLDLEWMEVQISALKEQVQNILANPQDRYGPKELPNGKVVNAIIESRGDQLKTATAIMEKLPKMLQAIDELREKEDQKVEARGKKEINGQAKRWLKKDE